MSTKRFAIWAISSALVACVAFAQSAQPPRATILKKLVREAKFVFTGQLVFAKQISAHEFVYGLIIKDQVVGNLELKCLISTAPYEIGTDYVFFTSAIKRECVDGGSFLRRGLAIKSFEGNDYVLLSDDKYLYPDFKKEIVTVQSVPIDSRTPIALWTGVRLKTFLSFVKDRKTP